MVNGGLVAIPVRFSATHGDGAMAMDGIDVLRIDGGKIAEVWLFSVDQEAEDAFWAAS